ncbi:hypothetical protein C5167_007157 [Papaver somniferum]|uniref:Uncharacterized protein n=1 Tax=Papaver somniferum TaxID=3469 RepID=A0A4Y7JJK5_PAPSO|nr:hypothetical protein C5167_007157 [Papaver somniferum]
MEGDEVGTRVFLLFLEGWDYPWDIKRWHHTTKIVDSIQDRGINQEHACEARKEAVVRGKGFNC